MIDPRDGSIKPMPIGQATSIMERGQMNGGWKLKNEEDRVKVGLPPIQSQNAVSRRSQRNLKEAKEQGDNSGGSPGRE